MGFRIFKIFFINTFVACCLAGCGGLRIGEVYKDPAFSGTNLGCMNRLRNQFEAYVQQNLQSGELGVVSKCLTTVFTIFKHHVSGEKKENYSPEELRNFFHEFFLQDTEISDELLNHLMVFKVALVGGSVDSLTLDEIDQLNNRIQSMEKIMADIYIYNHILFNQAEASFEELNESVEAIKKTSREFSSQIFKNPYSLKSASQLLQGISQLMNFSSDQNFLWFRAIKSFAPFILNAPSKDVILPQEWPLLLSSMTDLFSILLHVSMLSNSDSFSQTVLHYSRSFETFLAFLKKRIENSAITRSEILQLVQSLQEENFIPERIRYVSMEKMVDVVFGKLIARTEGDFSFGEKEFLWLENFYQTWNRRQKDIRLAVADPDWQDKISEENSRVIADLLHFKPLYRAEDAGFNVYLMYPSLGDEESVYKNLSMHSVYWQIAQVLLEGYAQYLDYGLIESEFGNLLKDFRGFIADLSGFKASEVEIKNYGRTEFIAGHLMLYETEGFYGDDELFDSEGKRLEFISQKEGTEFLAMTGFIVKTLKDLSTEFDRFCPGAVSRSCFMDNVLSVIQNISATMPQLSGFLDSLKEEERNEYAELLFGISVVDPKQIETLEFIKPVHFRNLVFALMYQEVTITRYDLNENTVLDKEELMGATFQLYDGLIEYFGVNLFCKDPQSFSNHIGFVYKYVVRHLQLPPPDMSRLGSLWEATHQWFWLKMKDVRINRVQLAKLVLTLAQAMKAKPSKTCS